MAEAANSTVSRLPHPRDATIGLAARAWEADICDLLDLSDITATIVEDTLSDEHPRPTKRQVRHILFCIFELNKKVEQFKTAYYTAIETR